MAAAMLPAATRFPKLRLIARIAAIIFPLCIFGCFLLIAAGAAFGWTMIPLGLSQIALLLFAIFVQTQSRADKKEPPTLWQPGYIAKLLIILWVIQRTEFFHWFNHLIESRALLDWRLVTAGALWTASGIFSLLKLVNSVTDEDIFRKLNEKPSDC